jgi:hypothetical protein
MTTAAEIARRWIELYNDGTPEVYGSARFLDLFTKASTGVRARRALIRRGAHGSTAVRDGSPDIGLPPSR